MSKLQSDLEAAHWGVDPVPEQYRKLSGIDLSILWGNLGVGLLVIVTGGFLTALPKDFGSGLSLGTALVAIVIGSVIGCFLLALGGLIGAREGQPTMVLLRPVLGKQGSWIPSVLNAAQLLGWTAFELWAMSLVADILSRKLFGFGGFSVWLILFSVLAIAFSVWGPLGVVRAWMERFASWALIIIGAALTVFVLTSVDLAGVLSKPGAGGSAAFGIPLDLVIVMPVSWLPLVADYNRFSREPRGSFWGTFSGYFIANIWFYALGSILIAGTSTTASPQGLAAGILSLAGIAVTGLLMLTGLLVGETDQAFANVYSGAVSLRNIFPKIDNKALILFVGVFGAVLAGTLTMERYELFLFLLGSIFVPLLGVWFADYFVLGNRTAASGVRPLSLLPWIAGFFVYHWIVPTPLEWWTKFLGSIFGSPLSERFPWLGASIPSFAMAFALHALIGSVSRSRARPATTSTNTKRPEA